MAVAHPFLLATCASAAAVVFSSSRHRSLLLIFTGSHFVLPQPQYQDDHLVGPPLGKEGEAPGEVRGRRYVGGPRHSSIQPIPLTAARAFT